MKFPFKFIDLTHSLEPAVPTWPGTCGFKQSVHIDYSDCDSEFKFCVMKLDMHAGIGTHMDAQSHCIKGGKNIDEYKLDELCLPCVVIDISNNCHEKLILTVDDILDFEKKYGQIPVNSCVLINTGWFKFWKEPFKYRNNHIFPSISIQAAELLIQRGIKALGIDTLSPDRPDNGFFVHNLLLGAGKIIVENVTNLNVMPKTGAFVFVVPLKLKGGTESPIRLVGLVS